MRTRIVAASRFTHVDLTMSARRGSPLLRRFAGAIRPVAALVLAVLMSAPAAAEPCGGNSWIQNVPGFDEECTQTALDQAARQQRRRRAAAQPLNDLRGDSTPLRSRIMLEAIEVAIGRYQAVAASGGWPKIPKGRYMRAGSDDERVPSLRRRLIITGDLNQRAGLKSYSYDDAVAGAVKRFQVRHGLRSNGIVDSPTLAHLNVSARERLQQLRVNRNRIRGYLAEPSEPRYILVNVPAFQLEAVEGQQAVQRHRVIVGRRDRQTPPLKAYIRGLNFFPYWRVPDSVAHADLIPRLQKEPRYLDKQYFKVLDEFGGKEIDPRTIDWRSPEALKVKFRQEPGPHNALGLVRIDMPNEHIVYMHDTPMKHLFRQRGRSYSAGCVRVMDVMKLAAWIARPEKGWDEARINEIMAAGIAEDLKLGKHIPVYFTYITAWADPGGPVHFRFDIYDRDSAASPAAIDAGDADALPPGPQLSP